MAVAVADGLVVPVLRDANRMTLVETATRRRELVDAARSGRLNAPEMTDATFTLSNLGPMGVDQFDAIVTPPQVAILATDGIRFLLIISKIATLFSPFRVFLPVSLFFFLAGRPVMLSG